MFSCAALLTGLAFSMDMSTLSLDGLGLSSALEFVLLIAYLPEPQSLVKGNGSNTTSDILQVCGGGPRKRQYCLMLPPRARLTPLPLGRSKSRQLRRSHPVWIFALEKDVS